MTSTIFSLSICAHHKCLKDTDLKEEFLLLIRLTGMLEAEASGCADTGEMKYLGVNCVQGTAGPLPLHSDTHSHVQKYSNTAIQYKDSQGRGGWGGGGSLTRGPTLQSKEKKDGVTVRPVQSPSRHGPGRQA